MNSLSIQVTFNGMERTVQAPPMSRLLDVLRHQLQLTGTKEGCGEGECGSCSVLLNGELVNSCLVPIAHASGATILTIEGVGTPARMHPVQQAFLECGGAQCGICTPGMVLATHHLLDKHPQPSFEQIREGLNGNLCRCTGYIRIFESVAKAASAQVNKIEDDSATLAAWNHMDEDAAVLEILPCCGSRRWAKLLAAARPLADISALLSTSDAIWATLQKADWDEAFASHPRIGEKKAPVSATVKSAKWSTEEQSGAAVAGEDLQARLQQGNAAYEKRFGRTYIVCATGKSAEEMLAILERRLNNDEQTELREAVEQQRQITQLRLRKWLQR